MSHDVVESSGVNESCGDSNEVMKEWNHDWLYFRQILDIVGMIKHLLESTVQIS